MTGPTPKPRRNVNLFIDILIPRRGSSDFMFMSEPWNPTKAFAQGRSLQISELKPMVIRSRRIQNVIEEICEKTTHTREEVLAYIDEILKEIGHRRNISIIRWIGLVLCKILKNNCLGLFVNDAAVLRMRNAMGSNPVIFVPTHRSYADFILMSYLCYHYDIEIPAIAAGLDFQGMWCVGTILRDCGAFFMRRSFSNHTLYRILFLEYISQLISNGDSAIEFFIEGTRSRTGKSYVPKFGFLTMALEPFFTGRVPDITLIPISITYDKVLEDKLYAFEMLGVPKPRESTLGLFKALRSLENYGKIFVQFAEPISVKGFCSDDVRSSIPLAPHVGCSSYVTPVVANICCDLAYAVIKQHKKHLVITTFNMIATAFANHKLTDGITGIHYKKLIQDVYVLKNALRIMDICVDLSDNPGVGFLEIMQAIDLHNYKEGIRPEGSPETILINFRSSPRMLQSLNEDNVLSGHSYVSAFPSIMLQQYVNPCCQQLVNPAILVVILHAYGPLPKESIMDKFFYLRELFAAEFVYNFKWKEQEFNSALTLAATLNICAIGSDGKIQLLKESRINFLLIGLLLPFLGGYYAGILAFQTLFKNGDTDLNVKEVQKMMETSYVNGTVPYGYVLSLDLLNNIKSSLRSMRFLIEKTGPNGNYKEMDDFRVKRALTFLKIVFIVSKNVIGSEGNSTNKTSDDVNKSKL